MNVTNGHNTFRKWLGYLAVASILLPFPVHGIAEDTTVIQPAATSNALGVVSGGGTNREHQLKQRIDELNDEIIGLMNHIAQQDQEIRALKIKIQHLEKQKTDPQKPQETVPLPSTTQDHNDPFAPTGGQRGTRAGSGPALKNQD